MLSICLQKGGGGWDWACTMPHQKPWYCTINVRRQPDKPAHYGTPQAKLRASGSGLMFEELLS